MGDVIAEIETDKSNVEIEAEEAGVLHIQAQPGAVVPVGKVIAVIGDAPAAGNGASANGTASAKAQSPHASPRQRSKTGRKRPGRRR